MLGFAPLVLDRGGLRPAPLGKGSVSHRFPLLRNAPAPRRGGPMCPPGHVSARDTFTGRHIGRPLQNVHRPQNNGRGQSPAPTGDRGAKQAGQYTEGMASSAAVPTGRTLALRCSDSKSAALRAALLALFMAGSSAGFWPRR